MNGDLIVKVTPCENGKLVLRVFYLVDLVFIYVFFLSLFFLSKCKRESPSLLREKRGHNEASMKGGPTKGPSMGLRGIGGVAEWR